MPPDPEQDSVNVLSPKFEIVTVSDPEVPLDPCHSPDAEHEDAFVEDHDNVTEDESNTDEAEELNVITGEGVTGSGDDPPPPPPPHADKTKRDIRKYE